MGRSTSELFRLAEAACDSPEAEAELVAELGVAIGEGALSSEALRRLRVALAHRLKGERGLYWRGLLDLLASIEIQRADLERRASEDDTMKTEALRVLVLALERGPQGPATLSRQLGRDAGGIVKRLAELERAGLVERSEASDDKSKPRALTARGLLLAARHREQPPEEQAVSARVAACVLADVRRLGQVDCSELVALARRVGDFAGLEELVDAVLEEAELGELVDLREDGTVRWVSVGECVGPGPQSVTDEALAAALAGSGLSPSDFVLVAGSEWGPKFASAGYLPREVVSPIAFRKRLDLHQARAVYTDASTGHTLARSVPKGSHQSLEIHANREVALAPIVVKA